MVIKIVPLWKPLALGAFAKLVVDNNTKGGYTNHNRTILLFSCFVLLFLGYKSCAELLNDGFTKNGVYQIQSQGKVIDVYCDQSSRGGGK